MKKNKALRHVQTCDLHYTPMTVELFANFIFLKVRKESKVPHVNFKTF